MIIHSMGQSNKRQTLKVNECIPLLGLPPELLRSILLCRFSQIHQRGEMRLLLNISQTCTLLDRLIKNDVMSEIQCIHGYTMRDLRPSNHYIKFQYSLTALDLSPKPHWWYGETDPDGDKLIYLKNFTRLTSLSLCSNAEFDDTDLAVLTNLTRLDLSGNETITDEALSHLTGLTWLGLHDNRKISDASVSLLTNLTYLDLSNHKLQYSSINGRCFSTLIRLTMLNVVRNEHISVTFARSILPDVMTGHFPMEKGVCMLCT